MRVFPKLLGFLAFISMATIAGVSATFHYYDPPTSGQEQMNVGLKEFIYTPVEMPDEEVTVVQRLSDILNKQYTTDKVDDSLDYLINETIQVYWGSNKDPFVSSLDNNFEDEIHELFGDVLKKEDDGNYEVTFILKNQDLNGDGYKEIAMYSTSDTLDNYKSDYEGTVRVFVTVFTPIVESRKIVGYRQVCESALGYCQEVYYSPQQPDIPSFSTDTWKDGLGYNTGGWFGIDVAITNHKDLKYEQYNMTYRSGNKSYTTKPVGNTLAKVLKDVL